MSCSRSLSRSRRRAQSLCFLPLYRPVSDRGVARILSKSFWESGSFPMYAGNTSSPVVLFHPFGRFWVYPEPTDPDLVYTIPSLLEKDNRLLRFCLMYRWFRLLSLDIVFRFPFASGENVDGEEPVIAGFGMYSIGHLLDRWCNHQFRGQHFLELRASGGRCNPETRFTRCRNIGDVLEFRYRVVASGFRESLWTECIPSYDHLGNTCIRKFIDPYYGTELNEGIRGLSPGIAFVMYSSGNQTSLSGLSADVTFPYQMMWNAEFEFKDFSDFIED